MNYYSVAADFNKTTIDRYCELNNQYSDSKIIETYGSITIDNAFESGRVTKQLPKIDFLDLKRYIEYSKSKGIDFNYTFNATYMNKREFSDKGIEDIMKFLQQLYEIGVRSLTVALPSLIEIVKASGYDFKIKASTLCQIINANKADFYKKLGLDRIVIDESINRDFKAIREITRVFGDKVEMIVNPICLTDCTYRMFHYNQISGDSTTECNETATNYFEHRCVLQRHGDIANMLKIAFVRPEDIKLYAESGIRYFKLQGRNLVTKGDPVKTVQMYFEQRFDGDVMDLIYMFNPLNNFKIYLDNAKLDGFIDPFYKKDNFCSKDCHSCSYCKEFSKKVIDYEKAEEVIKLSKVFYEDYDKFNTILNSKKERKNTNIEDISFDF